jgi:DNA-binding NarL/FixJ family response regulator
VGDAAPTNGNVAAGVLICDDNDAMRTLLGVIVDSSLGLRVVGVAADGNEAIVEATRLQPNVILLDLAMPNRSGLEALPELRHVAPNAQIIVFSGFSTAIVADQVIALGAASYLEKGASPDTIVATIEQALASTNGRPPSLHLSGDSTAAASQRSG